MTPDQINTLSFIGTFPEWCAISARETGETAIELQHLGYVQQHHARPHVFRLTEAGDQLLRELSGRAVAQAAH